MSHAILFDTDIGSDIDDAVALNYLLHQRDCEMVGITTVSGDVAKRAALARALCETMDADSIPVLAGAPGPILHGRGQPTVPQFSAIEERSPSLEFEPGAAIEFMRRTIRERPGEITLLAVGPMTNLALLFTLDPEIPSLLKRLVLMCGIFFGWEPRQNWRTGPGAREWNALQDPIATALAYRAGVADHLSIGIDVTRQCTMPAESCRERFGRGDDAAKLVLKMANVWFARSSEFITFHDPLAATCIFEPTLCEYSSGRVEVEARAGPLEGLTMFEPHSTQREIPALHRVATSVDVGRFFSHYFEVAGLE